MKRVHIIHDPCRLDKSTVADVENPLEYLKSEFKDGFPEHAKIYKGAIAVENDITEKLQKDELLINLIDESIWVVIWPSDLGIGAIIAIVSAVISAAVSIYMYLTMPQPEAQAPGSSNNELANRTNRLRPNGRVPEIFGTLRCVPDLIAEPYSYYVDGIEIEETLMCATKGFIDIFDVRDDETEVEAIPGTSVSVYNPDQSILSTPMYQAGEAFTAPPKLIRRTATINGQSLEKPNDVRIDNDEMAAGIYFTSGGVINRTNTNINFLADGAFEAGDGILVSGAQYLVQDYTLSGSISVNSSGQVILTRTIDVPDFNSYKTLVLTGAIVEKTTTVVNPETMEETTSTVVFDLSGTYTISNITRSGSYTYTITLVSPQLTNPSWSKHAGDYTFDSGVELRDSINNVDLDGAYTIASITSSQITLLNASAVNPDWILLDDVLGGSTFSIPASVYLESADNKWVGWFNITFEDSREAVFNIFFPQGLFNINKDGKTKWAWVEITIEYQEIDSSGNPLGSIQRLIHNTGRVTNRDSFGITLTLPLDNADGIRFRIGKTGQHYGANTISEAKIKSVYLTKDSDQLTYPEETVVRTRTVATDGALSIKERKLNMLVQRKLPLNGTGALTATNSAAQALIYLALDQKNGRRSISEVDIAQILAEENAVKAYFGNPKAAEFSYTLDDNNLSFEEIAGMVASSMFCEAYRYGNKLRIRFEQPQQNSVLLFNAANKAPNTEKRTKNFGIENKYDGIEIEYTSPDDDTRITYVASDSANPINTMQIKTSGIRSHEQAKTRAWREWNKLKYRNITCEFEALEESELLARNDRILVADNTVIKTKDGIIDSIDGLTLGLSHPIESDVPYFIYLQLADGRVDIAPCSYVDEYTVLLSRPPLIALVPEFTTYQLIESTETPSNAFMVTEIRPQGKMTNMLTCVNYDERYYQNDADFF